MMRSDTRGSLNEAQLPLEHQTLIQCREVKKLFRSATKGSFLAVDGVSLSIKRGKLLTLVGESGSGKTTLAKILAGLIQPTSGGVFFEGKPIASLGKRERQGFSRKVQYIPQYPDLALDPSWYIYDSIAEPLRIHRSTPSLTYELKIVSSVAARFGLGLDQLRRKPRDLSGGELQRAVLARSMVLNPEVLIADEPTSMLDPSTQARIVRQILDAQKELGFAVLLVTHDLKLARIISDNVCVMLGGKIIEFGSAQEIFSSPRHPYTSSLISSAFKGETNSNAACTFYTQCNLRAESRSNSAPPEFSKV